MPRYEDMQQNDDLDPRVREIMFGETATEPAGRPDARIVNVGEDGMIVACDIAAIVLANGINEAQPESTNLAELMPQSFMERKVPYERLHTVRDAIRSLGLRGDDRPPPPEAVLNICGVPEESFMVGDEPTPLLAAIAEALHDPQLMMYVASSIALVRDGAAAAAGGQRGRVAHAMTVSGLAGQGLVLFHVPADGFTAAPPFGTRVETYRAEDGITYDVFATSATGEGSCACGFSTGRAGSRLAMTQSAVHVRLEIEACLRDQQRAALSQ